jgi:cobalamin biosynthesis protein CobD/CbiB
MLLAYLIVFLLPVVAVNMIAGALMGQLIQRMWERQNKFRLADVLVGLLVTPTVIFLPRFLGYMPSISVAGSSLAATVMVVALSYVLRKIRSA